MDWVSNAAHSALFWTAVGSSAAVAMVLATLIPLLLERRRRPEPDWLLDGSISDPLHEQGERSDDPASWRARLTNAGDGPAFRLVVDAVGATVGHRVGDVPFLLDDRVVAFLPPGESAEFGGQVTGDHRMRLDEHLRDQRTRSG